MKKNLIALTVLGAMACAASAQNAVTVYGVVDAGVLYENGSSAAGSVLNLNSGLQSGSRLGFKGSEDLGGGMSANFVLETGINIDNGSLGQGGLAFGRQSWVGLSGGLGSVKLGRQYAPYFLAVDSADPFGTSGPGEATRLFASTGYRMNNTVNYSTPALGGFAAEVAYGFGEVAGNTAASRQLSLSVGYANGPLAAKLAYHNANDATGNNPVKNTFLGGTYDFVAAKAYFGYAMNKNSTTLDTRDVLIGVSVPYGASTVAADYIRKNDKFNSNANASQIALGYYYALSKRTNLYTAYSRLANDGAASYQVATAGATETMLAVGVRHKF